MLYVIPTDYFVQSETIGEPGTIQLSSGYVKMYTILRNALLANKQSQH